MPNYLKMEKKQQVIALLELGWSYRRIEAETGVRRETVSEYDRQRRSKPAISFLGSEEAPSAENPANTQAEGSKPAISTAGSAPNPAISFPGSRPGRPAAGAAYRDVIQEKLDRGLSAQRIFQDLVEEFGYGHSYESIKRFVRTLGQPKKPVGVYLTAPGEEAQVDFFGGAPTLHAPTGQWKRPPVFRMTLSHSRHGYEEAVWDQKIETFLKLHENAFRDFGGVTEVVRHDNLKAAVVRACWYDPDVHELYAAFAEHWGFTPLPGRPGRPQEQGKQERAGGYVKDNALKGHRFSSLDEHNAHLRHWNQHVARLRIHGTTRRQVWTHFLETDKPALKPLPAEAFLFFRSGERTVHPDGHVEVAGAFYPVPAHLLGRKVRVRWDERMIRIFHQDRLYAVHARVDAGQYARRAAAASTEPTSTQQAFISKLLARCERVGPELRQWAEKALQHRGIRALRLIQGALNLTRSHPKDRLLHAARLASEHQLFRYKDLCRLLASKQQDPQLRLLDAHPLIRPLTDYRLED